MSVTVMSGSAELPGKGSHSHSHSHSGEGGSAEQPGKGSRRWRVDPDGILRHNSGEGEPSAEGNHSHSGASGSAELPGKGSHSHSRSQFGEGGSAEQPGIGSHLPGCSGEGEPSTEQPDRKRPHPFSRADNPNFLTMPSREWQLQQSQDARDIIFRAMGPNPLRVAAERKAARNIQRKLYPDDEPEAQFDFDSESQVFD